MRDGDATNHWSGMARRLPLAVVFILLACENPTPTAPRRSQGTGVTVAPSPSAQASTGQKTPLPSPSVSVAAASPSVAPASASPSLAPTQTPGSSPTTGQSPVASATPSPSPTSNASPTPTPTPTSTPTPAPVTVQYELTTLAGGQANGNPTQELTGSLVYLAPYREGVGLALVPDAAGAGEPSLYFTDGLDQLLRKATTAGTVSVFAGQSARVFSQPRSLVFDSVTRCLYMADTFNARIVRVGLAGNTVGLAEGAFDEIVKKSTGTGMPEYREGNGRGDAATARLGNPSGLALVGRSLYVSDFFFHNISKIDLSSDTCPLSFVAGSKTSETGAPTASAVAGAQARFNFPVALCSGIRGGKDVVIVADRFNQCLQVLDPATGQVAWFAGSKTAATGDTDGKADAALFSDPLAIAMDGVGTVYVGESKNARVRAISTAGDVSTCVGSTAGYSNGTGIAARLGTAVGLAARTKADGSLDKLYIYDAGTASNAARIRQMKVVTAP